MRDLIIVKGSPRDFVLHNGVLFGYFPKDLSFNMNFGAFAFSAGFGNCAPGAFAISLGIAWLSRQAVACRVCPRSRAGRHLRVEWGRWL